ncbi:hypothetical protein K3G63_11245 [Hymenobacter sp. HSC-4F20]|uniref:cupin domain-containing protein n=1 Tax=Hymenobacter sp. HSC-4F20 TaxID=2864135 RepID=UPI001C737FD1|nr:cupin domain-containing protein [Hymenobacter sp. HSC-4F20]MBX0291019.1 hypothetical protein [Hymenobacter sp. HSC-4F20]
MSDTSTNCTVGDVTFEPGARNKWHSHPAGQILMVTAGVGYYQEKGQPTRLRRKGEVGKAHPGAWSTGTGLRPGKA